MKKETFINVIKKIGLIVFVEWPLSAMASTGGTSLPWESTLQTIAKSIQGPVLLSISTVMLVVTLAMMAFGEWGETFKKFLGIAAILSLCFGVTSLISALFVTGALV